MKPSSPGPSPVKVYFSRHERAVLTLLCESKSNKQVAADLKLSVYTVRWHISQLLRKLRLYDRTELIIWCLQNPDDVHRGIASILGLHKAGCTCDSGYCTSMRRMGTAA